MRTPTRHAKTRLLAAIAFLAWLAEQDRTLADAQQGDMTLDQVISDGDDVYLSLGAGRTPLPEPLGSLVVELVATGRSHVGLGSPAPPTWLFPGLHPGRPLHPGHLGERLAKLGIDARAGRRSALMHLAGQLPAAVLAEMLHLHATTAVHWVAAAGGDWSTYAAQVARDR